MPELLAGPQSEVQDVCRAAERASGWPAAIVEKDLWVTWALGILFESKQPFYSGDGTPIRLAFKGGTSLSMAYHVITRFSEDVDITMHFGDLGVIDKPMRELSRKSASRAADELTARSILVISSQVVPRLQQRMSELAPDGEWSVATHPADPLKVCLRYPHAITANSGGYLREEVQLEFGGRNVAVPANEMALSSIAHSLFPNAQAPTAAGVHVLLGEYTFWEKVTLAHAELKRSSFLSRVSRMSRHWSDLRSLYLHEIGTSALARRDILDTVIEVKGAMFRVGGVDYLDVARGQCLIAPTAPETLEALRDDYLSMLRAGMLNVDAPSWEAVLDSTRELQNQINSAGP